MLLLAWIGTYLSRQGRARAKPRCCCGRCFFSFPLPFIAILTGWFTAEVGRQPWTVYGVLRTADAMTPFLTARDAAISLVVFCAVYAFIFIFGVFYIYRLLRAGPVGQSDSAARRRRPQPPDVGRSIAARQAPVTSPRENSHGHVLGGRPRHQHAALCSARRLRSRRRHPVRPDTAKQDAARHDERRRADLGRQRNLAGRDRRGAVGRVSRRLCDAVLGLLSAAASDAGRA